MPPRFFQHDWQAMNHHIEEAANHQADQRDKRYEKNRILKRCQHGVHIMDYPLKHGKKLIKVLDVSINQN